jgi:hypothetical protein
MNSAASFRVIVPPYPSGHRPSLPGESYLLRLKRTPGQMSWWVSLPSKSSLCANLTSSFVMMFDCRGLLRVWCSCYLWPTAASGRDRKRCALRTIFVGAFVVPLVCWAGTSGYLQSLPSDRTMISRAEPLVSSELPMLGLLHYPFGGAVASRLSSAPSQKSSTTRPH